MKVAVFPFRNLILFPHASVPLYIFEPTYVRMIDECLAENRGIAIGLGDSVFDQYGQLKPQILKPKSIMGLGYPEIVERYEDGSLYLIMKGAGRVRLGSAQQHLPYLICEAEKIPDTPGPMTLPDGRIEELRDLLFTWVEQTLPELEQRENFLQQITSVQHIVDHLSLFLIEDRDLKQLMLETYSLFERIQLLSLLLQPQLKRLRPNHFYSKILKTYQNLEAETQITVQ